MIPIVRDDKEEEGSIEHEEQKETRDYRSVQNQIDNVVCTFLRSPLARENATPTTICSNGESQ